MRGGVCMAVNNQRHTTKRPVGRPRNEDADTAILRAAVALFGEVGLRGTTMDQVARRAGVGRATVYRRWRTREQMIAQALTVLAADFTVEETGDLRTDLFALSRWLVDELRSGPVGRLLPQIAAQMVSDPQFPGRYLDNWMCPWREAVQRVFARAARDGRVRPGVVHRHVADVLCSVLVLWVFRAGDPPISDNQIDDIIGLLLDGAVVSAM